MSAFRKLTPTGCRAIINSQANYSIQINRREMQFSASRLNIVYRTFSTHTVCIYHQSLFVFVSNG